MLHDTSYWVTPSLVSGGRLGRLNRKLDSKTEDILRQLTHKSFALSKLHCAICVVRLTTNPSNVSICSMTPVRGIASRECKASSVKLCSIRTRMIHLWLLEMN